MQVIAAVVEFSGREGGRNWDEEGRVLPQGGTCFRRGGDGGASRWPTVAHFPGKPSHCAEEFIFLPSYPDAQAPKSMVSFPTGTRRASPQSPSVGAPRLPRSELRIGLRRASRFICSLQRRASGSRAFESALSRVFDKPCRLRALTSESILSQMGTMEWNEKLILNQ